MSKRRTNPAVASTPAKPTPEQIRGAFGKRIPDLIAPGLSVLFCGINPGLYSGATGLHFARPGNRFWPALYAGGFTKRLFAPWEGSLLLEAGYGITTLVRRATATAAELRDDEFVAGRRSLERKVRRYTPRWVAVVGLGAYRTAFARPRAVVGLQPERIETAGLWVLPNPSGLNANHQLPELAEMFRALWRAVDAR
jgi:double-stranded uracil-DNA glycosylase